MTTFHDRFRYRTVEIAVYRGTSYRAGGSDRIKPFISLILEADDPAPPGLEQYTAGGDTNVYLVDPGQLDAWYRSHWTSQSPSRSWNFRCTSGQRHSRSTHSRPALPMRSAFAGSASNSATRSAVERTASGPPPGTT